MARPNPHALFLLSILKSPTFLCVNCRADFGTTEETVKDFAYFVKEQLGQLLATFGWLLTHRSDCAMINGKHIFYDFVVNSYFILFCKITAFFACTQYPMLGIFGLCVFRLYFRAVIYGVWALVLLFCCCYRYHSVSTRFPSRGCPSGARCVRYFSVFITSCIE